MKTVILNRITRERKIVDTKWRAQAYCKMFPEWMIWFKETKREMLLNDLEHKKFINKVNKK